MLDLPNWPLVPYHTHVHEPGSVRVPCDADADADANGVSSILNYMLCFPF